MIVTTLEDLDALPFLTVVRSLDEYEPNVYERWGHPIGETWRTPGRSVPIPSVNIDLPVEVLYLPATVNAPSTTTTEYGTRDVHAPDAPVFNTDMSLDQIEYHYRTRAADRQGYEIVQREVTQHYGPWTVYDPFELYDESKR